MSTGDRLVDYLEEIFNGDEEDMDSEKVADYIRTTLGYSDTRRSLANAAAEKLATQVSSLTSENERLRKERDEARATKDMHKERQQEAELALSSLRELESAARAWVAEAYARGVDPAEEHALTAALIAAVDALPPTPPATEGSDDTA